MKIVVHIDRVVLDGIALGRRDAVALKAALTNELTRLMRAAPPAALRGGSRDAVRAPEIRLPAGSSAAHAGRQIAASVNRGLAE